MPVDAQICLCRVVGREDFSLEAMATRKKKRSKRSKKKAPTIEVSRYVNSRSVGILLILTALLTLLSMLSASNGPYRKTSKITTAIVCSANSGRPLTR